MTELSHSDAQTYEMKDFEYLFWLRESEKVLFILESKKYDDCPIFIKKSILFKMFISLFGLVDFKWSLFPIQKSHRVGLALKLQGFD